MNWPWCTHLDVQVPLCRCRNMAYLLLAGQMDFPWKVISLGIGLRIGDRAHGGFCSRRSLACISFEYMFVWQGHFPGRVWLLNPRIGRTCACRITSVRAGRKVA